MDKIIIKGIDFYGFHGVSQAEQELGQRFIVDIELELPLNKAGKSDQLTDTVNYCEIYSLIKEKGQQRRYALLEALASDMAESILKGFALIERVSVCIKKPHAPIGGVIEYVEIRISRDK
ncbi:dihydroneopterin aldolase [bacterium]|nr:dihydroneopterin aldolase [bacterium]MBU1753649.1 dihydroneopterin aldolase [bacterium]